MKNFRLNKADYESFLSSTRPIGTTNTRIKNTELHLIPEFSELKKDLLKECKNLFQESISEEEMDPYLQNIINSIFPTLNGSNFLLLDLALVSSSPSANLDGFNTMLKHRFLPSYLKHRLNLVNYTGAHPLAITHRSFFLEFKQIFPLSEYEKRIKRFTRYLGFIQKKLIEHNLPFQVSLNGDLSVSKTKDQNNDLSQIKTILSGKVSFAPISIPPFSADDAVERKFDIRASSKYICGYRDGEKEGFELGDELKLAKRSLELMGDCEDSSFNSKNLLFMEDPRFRRELSTLCCQLQCIMDPKIKESAYQSNFSYSPWGDGYELKGVDKMPASAPFTTTSDHIRISHFFCEIFPGTEEPLRGLFPQGLVDAANSITRMTENFIQTTRNRSSSTFSDLVNFNESWKSPRLNQAEEIYKRAENEIEPNQSRCWTWVFYLPELFQFIRTLGRMAYDESEQSFTVY